MFKILDGRSEFFQWDVNRKLVVEDETIKQVHFCNRTDECSLVCDTYSIDGITLVDVPNILLQQDWRINVYGYDVNYTKHYAVFNVRSRTKPDPYIYTETEVATWGDFDARISALEEGGGGSGGNVDLSNYYTKEETDNLISNVEVDLTGYATEQYVNSAITEALGVVENGYY